MSAELKWSKGKPSEIGLYFVAVQYGDAAGVFDFIAWDGENWDCNSNENVIAYLSLQDFKNQLDIKWPVSETVEYSSQKLPRDDDLWSEV